MYSIADIIGNSQFRGVARATDNSMGVGGCLAPNLIVELVFGVVVEGRGATEVGSRVIGGGELCRIKLRTGREENEKCVQERKR